MRWLFAQQLRPFVTLAAGASLLLNLALLAPALYMLQVFDRVFASGSIETLGCGLGKLVARAWQGRTLERRHRVLAGGAASLGALE